MTYDFKKYIEIITKRCNRLPVGYNLYGEDKDRIVSWVVAYNMSLYARWSLVVTVIS